MKGPRGVIVLLAGATAAFVAASSYVVEGQSPAAAASEAPAAFDNLTNGFLNQAPSTPIARCSRSATRSPTGSARSTTRSPARNVTRTR